MACSAFASVAVGGGGVGFGFRWCWLSARMAGMLPSRKRARRRRMALRKDSLAFGRESKDETAKGESGAP